MMSAAALGCAGTNDSFYDEPDRSVEDSRPQPRQPAEVGSTDLVVFEDAETDFRTSDVYDANRDVFNFDARRQTLVWADGTSVPAWRVDGMQLIWALVPDQFRVSFGTEAGERRAYFIEPQGGTICDLNVIAGGVLSILPTEQTPPRD